MKIDDRIILYIDGQLNSEEKVAFEKELENSESLKEELEKYRKFIGGIKELKTSSLDESYFTEMIPRFRGRAEEKRKLRFIPKLALGTTVISVALIIFLFTFVHKESKVIQSPVANIANNITNSQGLQSYNYYSYQLDPNEFSQQEISNIDSTLNKMISQEIDLSPQSMNYISADNNTDLKNMLQGINEKEANEIYKQILHKRIF